MTVYMVTVYYNEIVDNLIRVNHYHHIFRTRARAIEFVNHLNNDGGRLCDIEEIELADEE